MQRPDFMIIGAMKCATSTLHEQLALQPGIFMSDLKEPNFFSNDDQYERGIDWYGSLFESAPAEALRGESSTHYTKLPTYPHTVERIAQHLPHIKLIYVMRHPIDRLVSQYIHEWSQRVISGDINQAITEYPELIHYSRYSYQLAPYFETLGRERVLPVFFERLLHHKPSELERICRFINYPQPPAWNHEFDAQNVSSERLRKSVWRDFLVEAPGLKQLRRVLIPKQWRTNIRKLWTMKQKPEITPQMYQKLEAIFDQDLAILGAWLGVDLCCRNFKTTVESTARNWSLD